MDKSIVNHYKGCLDNCKEVDAPLHPAVYRSKKEDKGKRRYMMTHCTLTGKLTGDDLFARMESIVTAESSSWSDKWELVSFSHAFLELKSSDTFRFIPYD